MARASILNRTNARKTGHPVLLSRTMGIDTNSHQVGTIRMGVDPAISVLDHKC